MYKAYASGGCLRRLSTRREHVSVSNHLTQCFVCGIDTVFCVWSRNMATHPWQCLVSCLDPTSQTLNSCFAAPICCPNRYSLAFLTYITLIAIYITLITFYLSSLAYMTLSRWPCASRDSGSYLSSLTYMTLIT